MHFGFALDSSDIDLWSIDLLDTHFDLLDADIPSKHFACLQDVFKVCKTSSRRIHDMSSRRIQNMSWRSLEDVFTITIFRLPRRLQDVLHDVFKTASRCLCKTSSRRLQDVLEDKKLLRWRRVEDVFKTCLEDQQMFAGLLF